MYNFFLTTLTYIMSWSLLNIFDVHLTKENLNLQPVYVTVILNKCISKIRRKNWFTKHKECLCCNYLCLFFSSEIQLKDCNSKNKWRNNNIRHKPRCKLQRGVTYLETGKINLLM